MDDVFVTDNVTLEAPVKRGRGRPPKSPEAKAKAKAEALARKKEREFLGNQTSRFGQELVEAGDNSKYLGHALTIANMPMVDLNNIDEVNERIDWYFNFCLSNDMKPTVAGLCNALKVQRSTLLTWRTGKFRDDSYQAAILRAYGIMGELWEHYMMNGKINPMTGVFLGCNNYGYKDVKQISVTPVMPTEQETLDMAAIEAKYDELPEAD